MQTPQTIAVMGAAETGKFIVRGLSGGRDRVLLCDHNFPLAQGYALDLQQAFPAYDIEAVPCSYEATWEADIIILALPSCPDRLELAKKIKAVANQKVILIADGDLEELQALLPFTKIVRIDISAFGQTAAAHQPLPCPVRGTDAEAVQTAAALVKTLGFQPVIPENSLA